MTAPVVAPPPSRRFTIMPTGTGWRLAAQHGETGPFETVTKQEAIALYERDLKRPDTQLLILPE